MYHLTIVLKVTLCASCNKRIFSISSVQEMQRVDRELFLELIESPVNPSFLHMSTPLKGNNPMFYLQINSEALWQWRVVKKQKQKDYFNSCGLYSYLHQADARAI